MVNQKEISLWGGVKPSPINVEATFPEFGHLTSSFCRVGFQPTARTKGNSLWLDAWIDMPSITVPRVWQKASRSDAERPRDLCVAKCLSP